MPRLSIPSAAPGYFAKFAQLHFARVLSAANGGAVLLMLAYYLGARIGFALQSPTVPQSILWLPNSVLLSALLLAPRRHWPVFFVVVYPAQWAVAAHVNAPLLPLSILYLTNWMDAVLGASLVLHFTRQPVLMSRLRNMVLVLFLAATLSTVVVSFADAGVTVLTGWGTDYWAAWSTRVRSNLLTNVVWVPMVLGLREVFRGRRVRFEWSDTVRAALLILVTVSLAFLAFSYPAVERSPGLLYAPLPILLIGAAYFGVGVLGLQLLIVALTASFTVLRGWHVTEAEVFALQFFLYTTAVPLLCFAAVVSERRKTANALRASERRVRRQYARLRTIYHSTPIGMAFVDARMRVVNANHRIVLLSEGSMPLSAGSDLFDTLPLLAPQLAPLLKKVFETGQAASDVEISVEQQGNGREVIYCLVSCVPVRGPSGVTTGANVVVQDVTDRMHAEQALRESYRQVQEGNVRRQDLAGRMITAQESERQRIARDLHDDFSQRLAQISMELGAVRNELRGNRSAVRDRVNRVRASSLELSVAMRDLSHDLHPAVLKHAGLVAALNSGCARFREQQGIDVTYQAEDIGDVPDDVALTVYRIAQEALSNVARHAHARSVQLMLRNKASMLELTVVDDGTGFDPHIAPKHVGLYSAKERARLVNGTLTIESAIGKGTRLRAVVPVAP